MANGWYVLFGVENLAENRKKCMANIKPHKDLRSARMYADYFDNSFIWRVRGDRCEKCLTKREIAENAETRRMWREVFEYCTI